MSMFCYQCQETVSGRGCTAKGVCGKDDLTSNDMDILIYLLKGISLYANDEAEQGKADKNIGRFITKSLFATITNANFSDERIKELVKEAFNIREEAKKLYGENSSTGHDACVWVPADEGSYAEKFNAAGILSTENEDLRSLRSLVVYGLKGISAYAHHAEMLGYERDEIYAFIIRGLASTLKDKTIDEMIALVIETGGFAVKVMELLDRANTETYGSPEITEVNIGVRKNPGILISGHDLRDMEELLKQTEGSGVDVYTHSEMLPANYYPAFKKYNHFAGNYGNAWWQQQKEFASFNGPILMTTNCIVPVKDEYRERIYTTGVTGYTGVKHIPDRPEGGYKDFSGIIEQAKGCAPPDEIEKGTITGGFAHAQVTALADSVVDAVKSGAIKRFIVMAGCDGRQKGRSYFTEVAETLPENSVILTAGCAKYRYNKLNLGDIGGIPRVLDAGQCNDSYSLAVVALKLKEIFGLDDINELPISFDVAWYEQKAVAVLLALLNLGFKGIRLGPTLPEFLSPGVAKVLVENFDIKPTGDVKADVEAMMAGR